MSVNAILSTGQGHVLNNTLGLYTRAPPYVAATCIRYCSHAVASPLSVSTSAFLLSAALEQSSAFYP